MKELDDPNGVNRRWGDDHERVKTLGYKVRVHNTSFPIMKDWCIENNVPYTFHVSPTVGGDGGNIYDFYLTTPEHAAWFAWRWV